MTRRLIYLLICLLVAGLAAETPREVFKRYRPAVCKVQFYKNVSSQSQIGSYIKIKSNRIGLLVSADGLVMVNSDVYPLSLDIVSGSGASFYSGEPSSFKVVLEDGSEHNASFVGKDDQAQVAFIQIDGDLPEALPFVDFAGTAGVEVGQQIYLLELLGEGYQFEPLFTPATINAVINSPRRKLLVKNEQNALSAGGLVLTANGMPIGVTLRTEQDYNFMMPGEFEEFGSSLLEIAPSEQFTGLISKPPLLQEISGQGKPWLGIGMQALTTGLRDYWKVPADGGVIIDRIYSRSPAAAAGLKVGDIIVKANGEPLDIDLDEQLDRFREVIATQKVGTQIQLSIYRKNKLQQLSLALAAAPRAIDLAEKVQLGELGLEVRELTWDILFGYNLPLETTGVYVYQVDRAAPVGLAGMSIGYIITHVNGQAVASLDKFEKVLLSLLKSDSKTIMFQVQVHQQSQFVFVELK